MKSFNFTFILIISTLALNTTARILTGQMEMDTMHQGMMQQAINNLPQNVNKIVLDTKKGEPCHSRLQHRMDPNLHRTPDNVLETQSNPELNLSNQVREIANENIENVLNVIKNEKNNGTDNSRNSVKAMTIFTGFIIAAIAL